MMNRVDKIKEILDKELKRPYCCSCANVRTHICDECHRKSFHWIISNEKLNRITKQILEVDDE